MEDKQKNKKPIVETGTWYRSLIEGRARAEYYRRFTKKLHDTIVKYFGKDECKRVFECLDSGRIEVTGIEAFLFNNDDISDPSLQLYNKCETINEVVSKSITVFKRRAEMGEAGINIRELFFVLADSLKGRPSNSITIIRNLMRSLITPLITVMEKSPYVITLIDHRWASEISEKVGMSMSHYSAVAGAFLSEFNEISKELSSSRASLPKVQVLFPVYEDNRDHQLRYLTSTFHLQDSPLTVTALLKGIPNLSEDTPQLRSALEVLSLKKGEYYNLDAILTELQRLEEVSYLKRYPARREINNSLRFYIPPNIFHKNKGNINFVHKETFEKGITPYFCEVKIDCADIPRENIESYIDCAKVINLTKGYYFQNRRDMNTLTFKITLINVKDISKEFIHFLDNKLKRIQSSTNRKFIFEVHYDYNSIVALTPETEETHVRIISDIHADFNERHGYNFNFGDDFVINCGDTAGNAILSAQWLRTYIRHGVTVIGNHLGYSSAFPEKDSILNIEKYGNRIHPDNSKVSQVSTLFMKLPSERIALLSNTCIEYKGIILIGTCLYTDFNLYGESHREECIAYAKNCMNDFKLPVVTDAKFYLKDKNGEWDPRSKKRSECKVHTFSPTEHMFYFDYSFNFIKEKVAEHYNKPIIIITHHAPSAHSIDKKYANSPLNAAFASNLNEFIIKNPHIRIWAHGHVHNPCDYILGETRVVCCPFGYNNENNFNLPYEYGLRIPISDIKSKKSWREILSEPIQKGLILTYEK